MKILPAILLMALLAVPAGAAPGQVVVNAQLIELSGDLKLPRDAARLAGMKGGDVFSAPQILTPSGKPAVVSVMRDFNMPSKGKFDVGVRLRIRPTLEAARVRYVVDWEQTEFTGFARSSTHAPMFTTRKIVGIDGSAALRKPVVLDLGFHDDKQTIQDRGQRPRTEPIRRQLFAVLRFTTP